MSLKRTKYNAKRVIDPEHGPFDSKGELERYAFLVGMKKMGFITDLQRQVRYPMIVNDKLVCTLVMDFIYTTKEGKHVDEDYKGVILPIAALKHKLFAALYGRQVSIVKKPKEWHH